MEVKLLNYTPLEVADIAICKCYGNTPHEELDKVKARINRVANVSKHASTIEHLVYNFDIDGISRACLQELSRHRLASYTVKSSRYTLQELKKAPLLFGDNNTELSWKVVEQFCVLTDNRYINERIALALVDLRIGLLDGIPNDVAKYSMPEAYKTSLVMSINARSLQNFLELRSSNHALWEIQELSKAIYNSIPEEHKFLYEYIYEKENN